MAKVTIGEVSSGTLRTADLIGAFSWELAHIDGAKEIYGELLAQCEAWENVNDVWEESQAADSESHFENEGAELLDTLIDALNEFAPPYCYFGASEGDGASFGFWVHPEFLSHGHFDELRVNDTSEVPADYEGEVLHVNDHGNATLYVADGKGNLSEVWAIV